MAARARRLLDAGDIAMVKGSRGSRVDLVVEAIKAMGEARPVGRRRRGGAMLYYLAELSQNLSVLNVFRYITFRAGGAFFTALLFGFLFGRPLIELLRVRQGRGQPIRTDGPESHILTKAGTPTMGGLADPLGDPRLDAALGALVNGYVWLVLFVTLGFGLIGFADDYAKVRKQTHAGVSGPGAPRRGLPDRAARRRLGDVPHPAELTGQLAFPVFKELLLDLGWFFLPFAMLVIVGAANAVNLTDGLDGLAIMPVMIAAGSLGVIAYVVGRVDFTDYLGVHYVPDTGEILIFVAALIGGGPRLPLVQRPARRRCSWATPARSRSAARSGRSRSRPSTRSCWRSSAACSSSRRCR